MRILALDLGTQTGWAINHPDGGEMFSGTLDLGAKNERPARFRAFYRWLDESLAEWKPRLLVYELPMRIQGNAIPSLNGYRAIAEMLGYDHACELAAVDAQSLKVHATGDRQASKDDMLDSARRKRGRFISSYDQADAIWLLDYAETHLT